MKTFTYDERGNLTVKTVVNDVDAEGNAVENVQQSDISAAQLAVHLPMLVFDMPPDALLKAQEIIKAL